MTSKTLKIYMFLLVAVLLFSTGTANATSVTFSNGLDVRVSITVAYFDADSGLLTTRGWWSAEPNGETVVTLNADAERGIYYAAFNRVPYVDSITRNSPQITRWVSPRTFVFTTDTAPLVEGAWEGRFFRTNGTFVYINERR